MIAFPGPYPSYTATYGNEFDGMEVVSVSRYHDGRVIVTYRPRQTGVWTNFIPATSTWYSQTPVATLVIPTLPKKKRPFFPASSRAPLPVHAPVLAEPLRPWPRLLHFASPRVWARRNKPATKETT